MFRTSVFFFSILFLACGKTAPETAFDRKQTEAEIRQMFDDYHSAIEANGLTAEFGFLDSSDDFYWVPPGFTSPLGFAEVKGILEKNAGRFRSVKFHWTALKVYPLTADIATYTGILGGEMVDTSGQESTVSAIESGTVVRRESGWKLLCGQSRSL